MSTIKDVAKKSGYSIATVSRYLNRNGYVSQLAAEKIKSAAESLDFVPMLSAQSIRTNRTKIIALVILTLENSFFAELASNLDKYCLDSGYKMILFNVDNNPEKERSYINLLETLRVDGIIFSTGSSLYKDIKRIPIVLLDRFDDESDNVSMVGSNNHDGGKIATKHLIDIGCKSVAYVRPVEDNKPVLEREKAFISVAKFEGINYKVIKFDSSDSFEKINFSSYDGLFVWNDDDAIDLLFHLERAGFKVPEEIKIVGYDNTKLSSTVYPSLTTVDQDLENLCKIAINQMISIIENEKIKDNSKQNIKMKTRLIVRETTGGNND